MTREEPAFFNTAISKKYRTVLYREKNWFIYKNKGVDVYFLIHFPCGSLRSYRNVCSRCANATPKYILNLYKLFKFTKDIM